MAASEFAKRQLKKHGWTEGSGLGKQENGRSDPIKVTLKMDKTGVGHDPGKEFTDHWWLRVFNEAAQKIGKKQKDDSKSKNDGGKKQNMTEMKNNLYKGFVKSSTLTNGVEEKHKQSDSSSEECSDEDNTSSSLPTLNDIHKFCGGATGHKAARFGIKMGGKLARIATHEKMFEEQLKTQKLSEVGTETDSSRSKHLEDVVEQNSSPTSIECVPESSSTSGENGRDKRKKKKHKKKSKADCAEDSITKSQCLKEALISGPEMIVAVDNELSQAVCKKNKKQKHKKESKAECAEDSITNSQCLNEELISGSEMVVAVDSELSQTVCKKDKKRKHQKKKHAASDDEGVTCASDLSHSSKDQQDSDKVCDKKRKRRHTAEEETVNENNLAETKTKKKRKKTEEHICELVESDKEIKKKRNKRKKDKM